MVMPRSAKARTLAAIALVALSSGPLATAGTAGPPPVPAGAKCAVCGMFVARYPAWAAEAVFTDGTSAWFDGPKDLFTYLFAPGRARDAIAVVRVRDYYTLAPIDARAARYVVGSDVLGPMGRELVPFARGEDAAGFLADHRGERVLGFGEITPALLETLR